jgi:hypothetical protein
VIDQTDLTMERMWGIDGALDLTARQLAGVQTFPISFRSTCIIATVWSEEGVADLAITCHGSDRSTEYRRNCWSIRPSISPRSRGRCFQRAGLCDPPRGLPRTKSVHNRSIYD